MRVNSVLIGNCGLLTGNILLLPEAAIDDGIFDIVALRPEGLFGWIQIAWKVLWENGVLRRSEVGRKILSYTKEVRTLRYLKGKEIVLRTEEPQQFQLDGDSMGEVVAVRARIKPQGLAVRIPATEATRSPPRRRRRRRRASQSDRCGYSVSSNRSGSVKRPFGALAVPSAPLRRPPKHRPGRHHDRSCTPAVRQSELIGGWAAYRRRGAPPGYSAAPGGRRGTPGDRRGATPASPG